MNPNRGLKSYCVKPDFFGLLFATILPFLFDFVFQNKRNILKHIFYTRFITILYVTNLK